jgi:hypothetical protein
MENQNQGLQAALNLFADYKKADDKSETKKMSKEELLSKYFTPRKEKEVFRILPPLQGRTHIETAFFHPVRTNASGGQKKWRKIYCPAHNDPKEPKLDAKGDVVLDSNGKPFMVTKRCPLCEKSLTMLAKQDQSIRKIKQEDLTDNQKKIKENNNKIYKDAMEFDAKKFYIVRGIDKGNTGDGVKFWRFKHNFKKQGVKDKLIPALENFVEQYKVDFADLKVGTDLIISVVDNQIPGQSKTYRDVSNIMARGQSKLYEDEFIVDKWVNDPIIWRDILKPATAPEITPEGFLDRLSRGVDPYWDDSDQSNKRWVFPDPNDAEIQSKVNNRETTFLPAREANVDQASDLVDKSFTSNVSIENVTSNDVGTYNDDAVDLGSEIKSEKPSVASNEVKENPVVTNESSSDDSSDSNDYDDLPF